MTLTEVLAPYGIGEDEFVEELSRDLHAVPEASASRLTDSEEAILREHGGIAERIGDGEAAAAAVLRSASSNLAALTRESLSVEQAASVLMVDGSRVRHRVGDRALYAFKIGAALRLPRWQFNEHDPIPGLRSVLAALPADLHPLEVAGFMTTPDAGLVVSEEPLTPRDWLVGGGDIHLVIQRIEHVDAW